MFSLTLPQMDREGSLSPSWASFLFAEDLSTHLLRDIQWTSPFSYFAFRDRLETRFSPEIGEAVSLFPIYCEDNLLRMVSQLTPHVLADPRHFSNFVYNLADKMFGEELFLELIFFCGCVIHVARHFHGLGRPELLGHAVVGIAFTLENKLKDAFEAQGGWEEFRLYCNEFAALKLTKEES